MTTELDRIPVIAEQARALGRKLGGDDEAVLGALAEFLERAHQFITSAPEVIQRAKIASFFSAYQECAQLLRCMAEEVEEGSRTPIRPQAVLRQAATAIERAVKEQKHILGDVEPREPEKKPKVLLH